MKRKAGFCILIALFIFHSAVATVFYVSTAGSDAFGDGSAGKPWRTLKFAAGKVPANQGHTIQLSVGTFLEMGPVEIPPGVNVAGAGKNLTTLKAVSSFFYYPASPEYATDKFLISLKSASAVNGSQSLRHFSIDGDSKQLHGGIYVRNRSHVIIESVKVYDTNFAGIWLWDVKDARMSHTELVNCSWGSPAYCVGALNLGNIERLEIDQLSIDESVGYGIKAIGPSGYNDISNLKIHDSRISVHPYGLWNNGSAPNIAIELWRVKLVGCEIYNTYVDNTISLVSRNPNPSTGIQTIRLHHNTIDMETRAKGAGYGVELSVHDAEVDHNYFIKGTYGIANWDDPMKNWEIHHNIFYALQGLYPGDVVRSERSGLHNVNFYNNTIEFTGDKTMNVIGVYGGTSEQVNVANNLFINNNTAYNYYPNSLVHTENGAVINNLSVKNNFFNKLSIGTVAGTYSDNQSGDPKIVASGNRPYPYYTPVAGSPLIDSGLDGLFSLLGVTPDIGALEYTSSLLNVKPSVNLTSPQAGSNFVERSSILIKANASDADGSISKVEFFHGNTKLGEDFNSPYTFEWSKAIAGSYSLRAKATDNNGGSTSSGTVGITVVRQNQAPSVNITSPTNDSKFAAGSTIIISANAVDTDGTVRAVEFYQGATKLGEDLTSPYTFEWMDAAAGSYSLTAKATDTEGAVGASYAINISVVERGEFIKLGLYAVDAKLTGNIKLSNDPTASRGSYFSVPVGSGTNHSIPPPAKAEFNFVLDSTDTYVVWVRVRAPSLSNQGYHIYDGKGNWTTWLAGLHETWAWVKVTNSYTDQVATFPFTAGSNTFRMAWFHDNVHVDRIIITNDLAYLPEETADSLTSENPVKVGLFAPDAFLTGDMTLTSDSTASKGSHFSMPRGSGKNYYIPPSSGAQFNFHLEEAGNYSVWVRVKSPTEDNQGFHIYDGMGWTTWLAGVNTQWKWVKVTDAYTEEAVLFPYSAGSNIFRMAWFHDNTKVDGIIITDDPAYAPFEKTDSTIGRMTTSEDGMLEGQETHDAITLFPNPVRDEFTLAYVSAVKQEAKIILKSATTAQEKHIRVSLVPGENNIPVNMRSESKGLYLVSIITSHGERYSAKIMVIE